ncbi:MAG: ATP-binding protein [Siculibacillus sp.]
MIGRTLFAKLAASLVVQLVVMSLVFLAAFVVLYRASLISERTAAAEKVGLLLQVSLENAMLKRDIDGLRDIVDRLGVQTDITAVMILDPKGEVRFSSRPERIGQRFDIAGGGLCPTCVGFDSMGGSGSVFVSDPTREVLRSVKAVPNREPCTVCHGPIADHPINGILVVDHAADGLKHDAALSAAVLAGSGAIVVLALVVGTWWSVRRIVLVPVAELRRTSRAMAAGDLDAHADLSGGDELAELGETLETMAGRLSESLGRVREREDFLQAMLDAVADGVRVIEPDYTVVRANRAFLAQTGLKAEAVVGRPCWASSHGRAEPCVPTLVSCPVAELKRAGDRMKFTDRHRRGVDEEMVVEVAAAAMSVADENGKRLYVVEAVRDLEEMAKISHEQKLSEIGQLATGVAHEIRNPLASIRLALQAAVRGIGSGDCDGAIADLELVDHEIERCIDISGSLLKLSMPSSGGLDLIDLDDVVRELVRLLSFEAESREIEVKLDLEPGLRVVGSDSETRMVVTNLVQNAFHAMSAGGRLTVTGRREGGDVVMIVEDTGVGIRPEDLDSIFLPFWSRRADGVRGTGLGLSICRAILKRAGGSISAASVLGQGSRFIVRMPDADHDQVS